MQPIIDECYVITDRMSERHVQCKGILKLISADSMFENEQYFDVFNSLWGALELLDLASCDLSTLEGEIKLLEPGALEALAAKTQTGVEANKHNGGAS